ncbi:peptidyl-prolyl cis-trans isomerase, FKBP-type domain-containing protein [Cardiosporidium cionae]|uniref:peptidylprolyl isomerase n=1 Tax=Cardiosporidium cionae TaxID=476202 RepID=A0ABQ7JAX5_9APIC|nr:peptidyl-prolyl cis-trans isomerase, FKBP-type domain-containing protein [Cardiosporidium cionae]|eukprot:KAF8821153.1 peptidyl-prolyl cis-trans isomerase, FKBP-type domain-containing protein [Cardiosporidium cionae]
MRRNFQTLLLYVRTQKPWGKFYRTGYQNSFAAIQKNHIPEVEENMKSFFVCIRAVWSVDFPQACISKIPYNAWITSQTRITRKNTNENSGDKDEVATLNHLISFCGILLSCIAVDSCLFHQPHSGHRGKAICQLVDKATYTRKKLEHTNIPYFETESGLQYRDIIPGHGKEATDGCMAYIHYEGKYAGSKRVLESSYRRSIFPIKLIVGGTKSVVIKGIEEGIRGMKEGGLRELIIPSNLGYPDIKEVLIYELRLIKISNSDDFSLLDWLRKKITHSLHPSDFGKYL